MKDDISSDEWVFRRNICIAMLNMVGDDVRMGRYSAKGRPNCTSVQLALASPIEEVKAAWRTVPAAFKKELEIVEAAIKRETEGNK